MGCTQFAKLRRSFFHWEAPRVANSLDPAHQKRAEVGTVPTAVTCRGTGRTVGSAAFVVPPNRSPRLCQRPGALRMVAKSSEPVAIGTVSSSATWMSDSGPTAWSRSPRRVLKYPFSRR